MTEPNTINQSPNDEDQEKARLERLDRSADEMARKNSKEEQNYDRDHGIFTK